MAKHGKKTKNVIIKILTVVLAVLLILGVAGLVTELLTRPQGIYVIYGGETYGDSLTSSADGITVRYGETASFTIQTSGDWGVYSPSDCVVKIVPNVDDVHDFEFTVSENVKRGKFSEETDLTAAFCEDYDGNGLEVLSDGSFVLNAEIKSATDILEAIYGEGTIAADGEYLLSQYPYIALSITSSDGSQTLTIPLLWRIEAEGTNLDKIVIVF